MSAVVENLLNPLQRTVSTTPTDYWSDSCTVSELDYAIANGAVGADTGPSTILSMLKKEWDWWRGRINRIVADNPTVDEEVVTWRLIDEVGRTGANLLLPVFERAKGCKGRLSMQTNPIYYMDTNKLVEQSLHFNALAPNIQVKMPATEGGLAAFEEATFRGVTVNATLCFSVAQTIAVAEAVERGLKRRERMGLDDSMIAPVCMIMVGRIDDWLKIVAKRDGIVITPGHIDWAGIAILKKAYVILKERGYRIRLLAAAYRHHLHWSELIGGDLILSIPYEWQVLFNNSDIDVKERINNLVDPIIVDELYRKFPDFRRAFDENGMRHSEFIKFGVTACTLRAFIENYREQLAIVRDVMIPNPEMKDQRLWEW